MGDKGIDTAPSWGSVETLQSGDEAAWVAFFDEFDPLVRGVVTWSKWHFKTHVRQELAQDIRAELTCVIGNFRGDSSIEYFIKRVCINRCIDRVRRQVREREVFVSLTTTTGEGEDREMEIAAGADFDPVQAVARFERASALKEQLDTLDETCRTAIQYFYMDGLPYKEIAEKLKVTVNTVGSRLAKCLDKLRGLLGQNDVLREYFLGRADNSPRG